MAYLGANLSNVETFTAYDIVPAGEYDVRISQSEIMYPRNGMGNQFVQIVFDIMQGPHIGRKIFDRISIFDPDPKSSGMAQRRLKSIAAASGHPNPNFINDTDELLNRTLRIKVGVREYNGNQYNSVKDYKKLPGVGGSSSTPAQAAAQQPQYTAPVPPAAAQPVQTVRNPWD